MNKFEKRNVVPALIIIINIINLTCNNDINNNSRIDKNDPDYKKTSITISTTSNTCEWDGKYTRCPVWRSPDTMAITVKDSFKINILSEFLYRIKMFQVDMDIENDTDAALKNKDVDFATFYLTCEAAFSGSFKYDQPGIYHMAVYAKTINDDDCADTMVVVVSSGEQK